MKLLNNTHYDNGMIDYILSQAGADTTSDFVLDVDYLSDESKALQASQGYVGTTGIMYVFEGTMRIRVCQGARLDVLAHELKHVEQALYLGEDFNTITDTELSIVGYDSAWYEIEANEFMRRWK